MIAPALLAALFYVASLGIALPTVRSGTAFRGTDDVGATACSPALLETIRSAHGYSACDNLGGFEDGIVVFDGDSATSYPHAINTLVHEAYHYAHPSAGPAGDPFREREATAAGCAVAYIVPLCAGVRP